MALGKILSLTASPGWGDNFSFQTMKVDARKYWRVGRDYTFAVRGFLGRSQGEKAQKFFLAGFLIFYLEVVRPMV